MFTGLPLETILISYVALLFSLSVHEASHATAAYLLEDDTAARLGRMTLNPIAHIDPLGTFLFPILGMATGIPMIGWAKPVPVQVNRLTRRFTMRTGLAIVSAAGPGSNLVLAVLSILALTLGLRWSVGDPALRWEYFASSFSGYSEVVRAGADSSTAVLIALGGRLMLVNFGLAIFNLLPVGPLDGGGILQAFLPYRWAQAFEKYKQHMYVALVILVFMGATRFIFRPLYGQYFHFLEWVSPTLLGLHSN